MATLSSYSDQWFVVVALHLTEELCYHKSNALSNPKLSLFKFSMSMLGHQIAQSTNRKKWFESQYNPRGRGFTSVDNKHILAQINWGEGGFDVADFRTL